MRTFVSFTLVIGALAAVTACQKREPQTLDRRAVELPESSAARTGTPDASPKPPAKETPMVLVDSPTRGALITSPVRVTGRARGPWYFEADFPVRVLDAHEKMIGTGVARAQGEWMTTDYVPFEVSVVFKPPLDDSTGTLVFEKSNPSGLPEHADEVRLPVRFR